MNGHAQELTGARGVSASVVSGLYSTYKDYLVMDDDLTIDSIPQFAGVLRDVDASAIRAYQVESTGRSISGQAVQIAKMTPEMTTILDIFRGKSALPPSADPETKLRQHP